MVDSYIQCEWKLCSQNNSIMIFNQSLIKQMQKQQIVNHQLFQPFKKKDSIDK